MTTGTDLPYLACMSNFTTQGASKHRRQPMFRVIVVMLLLATTTVVLGLFDPGSASAAVPVITSPPRVYGDPSGLNPLLPVPVVFAGTDPIAAPQKRDIKVDSKSTDGDCTLTTTPQVTSGCANVQLAVTTGILKMTMDPGMSTQGDPVGGQQALQFQGTNDQLNAALGTLTYTPPANYSNLNDTPAELTINTNSSIDDGHESTNTGSPNHEATVDIRITTLDSVPSMTDPASPVNVRAGEPQVIPGFDANDSDVNSHSEQGNMLFIAWVTCGSFDVSPSGNFHLGTDIKDLLKNFSGIDPSNIDPALDTQVINLVYDALPDSVKNLPLVSSTDNVSAIAGIGTLGDIKNAYSTVTFNPPTTAGTCTMTNFLSDLGNHGLPGHYFNFTNTPGFNPAGVEAPALGFSLPTPSVDFVVTVPQVTVNQQTTPTAQADPTPDSPIHFTATFTDDMQGFGDANSDVTLFGTAGATTAVVTPVDAKTYDIAVTGMTQSGTVIVDVPAGAAHEVAVPVVVNAASSSTDHTVTFLTNPRVTINQSPPPQTDPTSLSPIDFDVIFSRPVVGFTAPDVDLSASTAGTLAATVTTISSSHYTVHVTGMSIDQGHVIASIPGAAAQDATFNALTSSASSSTDNDVQWVEPTAPSAQVTLNPGTTDPSSAASVTFLVTFSEPVATFDTADVAFVGSAGANAAVVTQVAPMDGSRYTVAESGMPDSGNVNLTVAAGSVTSIATGLANTVSNTATLQWIKPAAPVPPTTTVSVDLLQANPTSASPIVFDVIFSEGVTGFDQSDVTLTGSAIANATTVTMVDASHYTVSVSGMNASGSVQVNVGPGLANGTTSLLGNLSSNLALVTFNKPVPVAPTTTVSVDPGQVNPTSVSPIIFDVMFSEAVSGFDQTDVTLTGSANANAATVTTVDAAHYTVAVSGMPSSGSVQVNVGPGLATGTTSLLGNLSSNLASVTFNKPTPPVLTINQSPLPQTDPTFISPLGFDIVSDQAINLIPFNQLTIVSTAGPVGGFTIGVSLIDSTHQHVTISGMTQNGDVTVSIPANATTAVALPHLGSAASTSADNSITFQIAAPPSAPTVTINQAFGQADPTSTSPIAFDVVFSAPVIGFGVEASDATISGTAGGALSASIASIDSSHFQVRVTGMTTSGTVIASIPAGAAQTIGLPVTNSQASTSTDNLVSWVTPPLTIAVPPDKIVPNDPGQAGAVVTFAAATSTGGIPPVTISCTKNSGDFFPLGQTVVSCTAIDSAQQQELVIENTEARQPNVQHQPFIADSASFTITVVDNQAPTISRPDITVHTSDPAGIVVNYGAPAAADNSGIAPTVSCTPATGIVYPVGTTPVTCVATDGAGNTAQSIFHVTVILDSTVTTTVTTTPGTALVTTPLTTPAGAATPVPNPATTGTPPVQLPATGTDSGQSLRFAVALSIIGFLLLIFARRRKMHI